MSRLVNVARIVPDETAPEAHYHVPGRKISLILELEAATWREDLKGFVPRDRVAALLIWGWRVTPENYLEVQNPADGAFAL